MLRRIFFSFPIMAFIQLSLGFVLSAPSLAQEWKYRVKPRGTIRIVDLHLPSASVFSNYAEGLVMLDKDNKLVPCLAEDMRWVDDRTIEFKLRQGVSFHNGEKFNAEAVRVNWEEYKKMESPRIMRFLALSDETRFEIIDEHTVRFTFPEPDGLAFVKFQWFCQFAPAFFKRHKFDEMNYGYLPEPGPWGTGPFKFVEGSLRFGRPSDKMVLEASEGYWDRRYPKVKKVIFDNTLIGNRKEAMRLCRETEGQADIVTLIRPLDTLKVAMSKFAKVIKSKDITSLTGFFNQRKRGSKWRDIRLRKAVNYAINRKELWKYGAKANAHNLGGIFPLGLYGHDAELSPYSTYDTTKARALLAETGYPDGFEVKIITYEAFKLETQIIRRMLERIGLTATFEVLTKPEFLQKQYMPLLDKPPEEQDWDIAIIVGRDWYGHIGVAFFTWGFLDQSDWRWIEYDPEYEEMWKETAKTLDPKAQEKKIQEMARYLHDRVYRIGVYSPITLYAVNKEVNFVPQKHYFLRFKETSVTDNHWSVRRRKK